MFEVNNRKTSKMCKSLLIVKTHVVLVLLFLTLNISYTLSSVSIVDFEQVNVSGEVEFHGKYPRTMKIF